jgi:hypothetical protein
VEGLEFRLVGGQDLGLRPGGASYALTVDFPDEESYRIYDRDAEHNRIRAEMFAPISESIERVQFRLPDETRGSGVHGGCDHNGHPIPS